MKFKKGNKIAPGGAREGSGRPSDEVKELFREMLHTSGAHKKFETILKNENDPEIFLKAYQIALDRGFGKPKEHVDMNLTVNLFEELEKNRKYASANNHA